MSKGSDIEYGSMDANIRETDLGNPEQEHSDDQQKQMSGITDEDDKAEKEYREKQEQKDWEGQQQTSEKQSQ